jgi:hypothetical protein
MTRFNAHLGGTESYTDILVITDDHTHEELETSPPAGSPAAELTTGLTIELLPRDLAERVIHAATPRGENYDPVRQFGQLYSFVRRGPLDNRYFTFDPDALIRNALQLSRLIVPNAHSTDYAARVLAHEVFPFKREEGLTIAPLHPEHREFAFRIDTASRGWLTDADADELGRLLRRWLAVREHLPQRVKNAMWWSEWTARTGYMQPAFVNTVSAFEALVSTNTAGQRAEFVVRALAAAEELEETDLNIDAELLDRSYTARSEITHGAFVAMNASGPERDDLVRLQAVLRGLLRRAIYDDAFAAIFATTATVDERWPVPGRWRDVVGLAARRP